MTGKRPKILFVTTHSPEGKDYGARLRARHLSGLLNRFADVTLVVAGAPEKYFPDANPKPGVLKPAHIIDYETWPIGWGMNRLRHEFSPRYLNLYGVGAKEEGCRRMRGLADEHDLVWLHGLRIANGLRQWRWPRSILDIDDIPSGFYRSVMDNSRGMGEKLRAWRQHVIWRRHEAHLFERFDSLAVCSEPDRTHFKNSARVTVIPNGFEAPAETPAPAPSSPPRIGFMGNLVYAPNANGLRWFIREVWPMIRAQSPQATLRIMGDQSDRPEWSDGAGVQGLGWVADADAEMATWSMTVVPIFEGGGTRLKIANAFSRKTPVVSTHLGAHGYDAAHGREMLLADSPVDFAAHCLRILKDPATGERLAETAWEMFLEKWTWEANLPRLQKLVDSTLARAGVSRRREPASSAG